MEPTTTYVLEVCGDGLGVLSGEGQHAVVTASSTPDGLSVQPVALAQTLAEAWLILDEVRLHPPAPDTKRLTE